ncbi:Mitogen-activated protein kinase [Forsythia ovata]|uniref:Mitogen-activated protein kinase n=1 Tax=Forsythia ovata TaxID=205694 RepID=A0ABD1WB01_9LAMI
MPFQEFFTEYGEANLYEIQEVVGKGSYGVVAAAVDTHTGEKVAIKKIDNVFEHVSEATRILREIKLLRLLRHPDIAEIKAYNAAFMSERILRIYLFFFELMETDLHHVIKTNDDLGIINFFLYELLRALKYIHSANVFHRDLKPKNILANADCKLKICDFGLARASFGDAPSAVFWTYTPAIDIWSIGCIFAEILMGKPLFPGKNVFPNVDPLALRLLERLTAFDPKDRPYAEENSNFNPKRLRDEIQEIVVSEGGQIPKKKRNTCHKKMSIAQIVSNLAEQVQMLVQKNRARITLSRGRIVDNEKIGVETRVPAASHSHPYINPMDSRRYQPIEPLKERERRPVRSSSVFDRIGDEADSHKRKTPFHDSRKTGFRYE